MGSWRGRAADPLLLPGVWQSYRNNPEESSAFCERTLCNVCGLGLYMVTEERPAASENTADDLPAIVICVDLAQ